MTLLARSWPEWTVFRVFGLLIARSWSREELEALGAVSALSSSWQARCEKLLLQR
jgi:MOSC domain-containing protein YiiM